MYLKTSIYKEHYVSNTSLLELFFECRKTTPKNSTHLKNNSKKPVLQGVVPFYIFIYRF